MDMRRVGMMERVFGTRMMERMKSPMFATVSLLAVGAAFAAVMVLSYPDAGDQGQDVPIVKAEAGSFKDQPDERGGMEVPNQDSTIFDTMRSAGMQEAPPIENLLDQEKPADGLQAFAREANQLIEEKPPETGGAVAKPDAVAVETPKAVLPKSIEPMMKAQAEPGPQATPAVPLKPAGSSEQAMDAVRSVLDKKVAANRTAGTMPGEEAAAIKPAAGMPATSGTAIKPGDYYIQLASISEEASAPAAWKSLQKSFPGLLQDISYRVQKADISGRGQFYRIQAGPMSKDSAERICASIKSQKPGGCLVVR